MTFGNLIKTKRLSLDLGLRKVARLCAISPTYLSRVENDLTPPPSEGVIYRLASVLDFDADELLIEREIIPLWARTYIFENWSIAKEVLKLEVQKISY